ncbi:hypothetical protein RJ641_020252 [Dillenia turbinata]|uniref:Uncharacterized protein n=1 Tax=Dillenia turbinata TaxID=194707 RepID=A0AAN8YWQ5_9MAGN
MRLLEWASYFFLLRAKVMEEGEEGTINCRRTLARNKHLNNTIPVYHPLSSFKEKVQEEKETKERSKWDLTSLCQISYLD